MGCPYGILVCNYLFMHPWQTHMGLSDMDLCCVVPKGQGPAKTASELVELLGTLIMQGAFDTDFSTICPTRML